MEISIIITNWNGLELLKQTVPTILDAAVQDPDNFYEIIMVDDCSTDTSIAFMNQNYPDIKVIKTPENLGYMHANNFGVKNARYPLVFCINNDIKITPPTIPSLLKHFNDEKVFAASGKIYDWDGKFLYGNRGGYFKKGHFSYYEKDENDVSTQTLFACGGAFLCRKKTYLELGGYDAELFSPYYYDETDLCFRALKQGLKIVYEPSSTAYHKVAQTASRQYKISKIKIISARNNYFFSIKNIHDPEWTLEMMLYIPLFLIRDLFCLKFRFWIAFNEVTKQWKLLMQKRAREKSRGKISEKKIFAMVNGS